MSSNIMGEKINKLRLELGLTLEEVGDKVGVGKSTVRKWENGMISNMRRDKILKLANALNTTPSYLMGWEDLSSDEQLEFVLSDFEKQIIIEYRKSDEITQAMVLRALSIKDQFSLKGDEEKMA